VGSHSVTHPCLGGSSSCRRANGRVYSYSQAVSEIQGGHQAVYDVLGWVDPFFRFPYGESSPELKNYLRQAQVAEFFWSIDSEDWKATSNRQLLDKVWAQLDARGRGVILFHDIQRRTAEIMPQFLSELYYKGYSVVQIQPADPEARYKSKIVRRNKP
ncbi:MAG: polysaccharide deacetylase family protein, partial [Bdellovibrio sp.]